jgi:hypothetical protein
VLLEEARAADGVGDRARAGAALIGETGDHGAAPELATALRGLVNEAEADLALEGVAATALRALGRLGGPDASARPSRWPATSAIPTDRRRSRRWGTLCDPVARPRHVARARHRQRRSLAAAAQNAEKHCGWR